MKVIGHTSYGAPEVLREVELPDPVPQAGEVVVRVHAAAVNPADTLRVAGTHAAYMDGTPRPWVPGMDFAGTIEHVADPGGTALCPGDRVMGFMMPSGDVGAYSERVAVPSDTVVRVPEGTDFATAAAVPMSTMTATMALDLLDLPTGALLAVSGAAGTVGSHIVQMAKMRGLHVIADAAPRDRARVQAFGADEILDRGDDLAERIRQGHPDGVDGATDAAILDGLLADAVRDGGAMTTFRRNGADRDSRIRYLTVSVNEYVHEQGKLQGISEMVGDGRLRVEVAGIYPAAAAAAAHRRLAEGGVRGRLILTFI